MISPQLTALGFKISSSEIPAQYIYCIVKIRDAEKLHTTTFEIVLSFFQTILKKHLSFLFPWNVFFVK